MRMIKIQISDKHERTKGFAALVRKGRVMCFRDNVFIIPEPGLEVLKSLGVHYVELGRGGMDYAQKALRDSLAAQT